MNNVESTRGILNPNGGDGRFRLARHAPAKDLSAIIDRHWIVHWDLRELGPYEQETLPYPQINLVFGTHQAGLHGINTARFVARLEGRGWAVGTKFHPGGFRALWPAPICDLTNRSLSIEEAFGTAGATVDAAIHQAKTDEERIELVTKFLRSRIEALANYDAFDAANDRPPPSIDHDIALARQVVELAQSDRSILRVADLAERAQVTMRKLQRLFLSHVGVSPSWVIRRFRVQEAAERIAQREVSDWTSLAQELGYFDQAHFIHEFKSQIGKTPGEYAAICQSA